MARKGKYSEDTVRHALMAYRETKSPTKVSKMLDIPLPVIEYWKKTYNWDKKLFIENKEVLDQIEKAKKEHKDAVEEVKQIIGPMAESFNFTLEERTMVAEIKSVKAVILESIIGPDAVRPVPKNADGLKPPSFDHAMKGLKICWDLMYKVLSAKRGPKNDQKPDLMGLVQNNYYYNEKGENETAKKGPISLVPRREDGNRKS